MLIGKRGREADEGLAAPGLGRAGHEVELPAGAGDVPGAGALGGHLAVEVHGDTVVDGHHVVDGPDELRRVHVLEGADGEARVPVHPLIELFRAEGHAEHALVPVHIIFGVGQLPGGVQVVVGVGTELGVHTEVLQVGVGDHVPHGVGHAADAQLQTCPVLDIGHDAGRDPFIELAGLLDRQLEEGLVLPLHHVVHLGDVHHLVEPAAEPGQVLVDLHDDDVRLVDDPLADAGGAAQIEIPVLVHGRDADHGYVHGEEVGIVGHHVPEHHGDEVAEASVAQAPLVARAVPGVVDEVLPGGVALHGLQLVEDEVAPDLHVEELVPALAEGPVQ